MNTILIVDDELAIRESLRMILKRRYDLMLAASGEEALTVLESKPPDLILLDIIMPGIDGMETLRRIKEKNPKQQVVMITATKTVKTAVEAMKLGAFDYLTKPFDVNEITHVVDEALKKEDDRRFKIICDKANIIGKSKVMQIIFDIIQHVADRKTTVLISGESGTGKELVARAIHFNGPRRDKPFVAINCAAIPETLIESELFGHEKGAFTNAYERRIGHFELSHSGTLFLDEITELSLYTQAKILRFLQEKEFIRVGGAKPISVDTRLITATNRNLDEALKEKKIREDFYYRINIVPIVLPPLRERREDIPLLVDYFLKKITEQEGRESLEITEGAMEIFKNYDWPGNVREMENLIERLVALSQDTRITPETIPLHICQNNGPLVTDKYNDTYNRDVLNGRMTLEEAESEFNRDIILNALEKSDYVQSKAAKMLGITRRILKYKMDKLGISSPDEESL
jgi:two-component system, NtrC family, response regulator AtoC